MSGILSMHRFSYYGDMADLLEDGLEIIDESGSFIDWGLAPRAILPEDSSYEKAGEDGTMDHHRYGKGPPPLESEPQDHPVHEYGRHDCRVDMAEGEKRCGYHNRSDD